MREVEVKAVVRDWEEVRRRLHAAGARPVFAGTLEDRRYDSADRSMGARDELLRVRVMRDGGRARVELGWKGPTGYRDGYKVREEIQTLADDPDALVTIVERLGFVLVQQIDREIEQFELHGATVRLERYPRMDDLVEVEGAPDAIERAVSALGIARAEFTSERLPAFVRRYEQRTGERAALSGGELSGTTHVDLDDA
ncbi:MAG: class IV adenylate cyclase [Gemmatimonadaceae bacterium]